MWHMKWPALYSTGSSKRGRERRFWWTFPAFLLLSPTPNSQPLFQRLLPHSTFVVGIISHSSKECRMLSLSHSCHPEETSRGWECGDPNPSSWDKCRWLECFETRPLATSLGKFFYFEILYIFFLFLPHLEIVRCSREV